MKKEEITPRETAVYFELQGGTGGITAMCSCNGFVEMYKIDKTYRVQTPQDVDPENKYPETPWLTTPVSDVGSKNPIVARIFLQGIEMLKSAAFEKKINKENLIMSLHKCKEELLVCDKISKKISTEIDSIVLKLQTGGLKKEKNGRGLNQLPHLPDLISECNNFLIHAKRVVKASCELTENFFGLPHKDSNFDKLAITLQEVGNVDTALLQFILSNSATICEIIELRNCVEHPKEQNKLEIHNFQIMPGNPIKISMPEWFITAEPPRAIKEDMLDIVNYVKV